MPIETEGLDHNRECPECKGALTEGIDYNLCPHCGHRLVKKSKVARGTTQWQCPECGEWDYESMNPGGRGPGWHDCQNCGWRESSPTDVARRHSPADWDEDEDGQYDYDEWYDQHGNPHPSTMEEPHPDMYPEDTPHDQLDDPWNAPHFAKFQVVTMGEMQQPGGVGATQTTGLVDGEGIEHPDNHSEMTDAGKNSFEQNVALETWVNFAVDMLNRGKSDQEVEAQLAHDGCPEPEKVLQRAKEQPLQDPVGNEGAADPFETPAPSDATSNSMESVSQQPPVLASDWRRRAAENILFTLDATETPDGDLQSAAEGKPKKPDQQLQDVKGSDADESILFTVEAPARQGDDPEFQFPETPGKLDTSHKKTQPRGGAVRIAGTSWRGIELDRWEDLWGQEMARIALNDGGIVTVAASTVESDGDHAVQDPATEIQTFIDGLPQVEPTRPSILARVANLKMVRSEIRGAISKLSFSDQVKLERMDRRAEEEIRELTDFLGRLASDSDMQYVREQQRYRQAGQHNRATMTNKSWNARISETAAIFVQELAPETRADKGQVSYAAARYAQAHNGDVAAFVAAVQKRAEGYYDEPMPEGYGDPEYDAEAEAERRYFDRLPGGDMHGEVRGWNDGPPEPDDDLDGRGMSDEEYWSLREHGEHPDYRPEEDPFAIWPGGHPMDR